MTERAFHLSEHPGWFGGRTSRRIASVVIHDRSLLSLLTPGRTYRIVESPVPDDARIVGVEYEFLRDGFVLYLESETFEEVSEGELPPTLPSIAVCVTVDDTV